MRWSVRPSWLAVLLVGTTTATLTPLTKIAPTAVELDAFAATVVGVLDKLDTLGELGSGSGAGSASGSTHRDDQRDAVEPDSTRAESPGGAAAAAAAARLPHRVVHVVGASSVEAAVDWTAVCLTGATVVLLGPEAVPLTQSGAGDCVLVVPGVFSRTLVASSSDPAVAAVGIPDVFVLLNCDLYHIQWRRSLAELLLTRKPVALTTYCEFEGHALTRLLRWPEIEFAASTLEQSDSVVKHAYGTTLAGPRAAIADGTVPESRILWKFAPNPHAHDKPRECYSLTTHGVRNAYWIGFVGEEDRQDAKTDL